ncbi:8863_t:CDS:2 [Funneliformis geosporum]|uniref:8863_t:CDS:1 n=1 Tax=Funneliformis geosporum TaxID=1117311 RepID=A0A9W4WLZ4_9GLOM|nr:8863_t:CDS:2 [Funneliformis geosporum]
MNINIYNQQYKSKESITYVHNETFYRKKQKRILSNEIFYQRKDLNVPYEKKLYMFRTDFVQGKKLKKDKLRRDAILPIEFSVPVLPSSDILVDPERMCQIRIGQLQEALTDS